jgi:glycosyltransferase involved in cell wall biosynthesis
VLDTWFANPDYPPLLVLNYLNDVRFLNIPFTMRQGNISVISRKVERDELLALANSHGLHLCPSTTEGFGHYINEAKSTGAVVITTDAEPMNRLVT